MKYPKEGKRPAKKREFERKNYDSVITMSRVHPYSNNK